MSSEWRSSIQQPDQYNKRPVAVTTSTNMAIISASSSRMFTNYEISDEICRKQVQCLEKKYGGRIRAHTAARTIQRAYRRYRLNQQWNNLTLQPNGSTRSRYDRSKYYDNHALPENQQLSAHDKQHLRQLALSQPSLRYNPVTSLRAQLRAEAFATEYSSPTSLLNGPGDFSSPRAPPSPRPLEPTNSGSQRPYIELMSPRLTQRRSIVPPNYNANSPYRPNFMKNGIHDGSFQSPTPGMSPLIWVPRSIDAAMYNETHLLTSDYAVMNNQMVNYQTNSLPRLDRRNERVYHNDKACS
uniref:Uncharacterized protein n=1 Tax=Acrobeloides nanus TaxID=290746 RepID=A0A914BX68_9BILA